jgi:hypothetical protein
MTEKEQKQAHQEKVLQMELQEQKERVAELEEGLRHAEMAQDRSMMRMEREHAEETQRLVEQSNARVRVSAPVPAEPDKVLAQKVEELEAVNKDLYYYKQSYRELKRKLKKIQTAVKEDVEQKQQECDTLQAENVQISEELRNMKHFMVRQSQPGGTSMAPVRVSRSSLRGMRVLDAEEVQLRSSKASGVTSSQAE